MELQSSNDKCILPTIDIDPKRGVIIINNALLITILVFIMAIVVSYILTMGYDKVNIIRIKGILINNRIMNDKNTNQDKSLADIINDTKLESYKTMLKKDSNNIVRQYIYINCGDKDRFHIGMNIKYEIIQTQNQADRVVAYGHINKIHNLSLTKNKSNDINNYNCVLEINSNDNQSYKPYKSMSEYVYVVLEDKVSMPAYIYKSLRKKIELTP